MLIESGISGNTVDDGLKCLVDNCSKKNVQAALLGADHFQLGGTPYEIADRLRDNQIAALLDFDSYLHGKMSLDHVLLVMVMNRKNGKLVESALYLDILPITYGPLVIIHNHPSL